jgi:hypothetical protein
MSRTDGKNRPMDADNRHHVMISLHAKAGIAVLCVLGCLIGMAAAGCGDHGKADSASGLDAGAKPDVLREAVIGAGVQAVAVDNLLRRTGDYDGRLAVRGVVVRSVPERGALVLVDVDEFKSCGLNACTDASMPVRIEMGSFEGALPRPGMLVTLIGDYEAQERGFAFELVEIHHDGGVVLARRAEAHD